MNNEPREEMKPPVVSVIIPCRDEEKYIRKTLDSILENDFPKEDLEVLVVDGMSSDGTLKIAMEYSRKYPFIKTLKNPNRYQSSALNIGIRNSKSQIIMRMDAHSYYNRDYISRCVDELQNNNVDNVGGICITLPGDDSLISKSIALALSHRFGVGNSYFRVGVRKSRYVDTVPFGCYKREVFQKIGFFDESLVRNQDDELNLRLIKNGGKILLDPEIISYYYARDSLSKLWKMYYQYGYFKPLVALKVKALMTWRQLMPAIFVGSTVALGLSSIIAIQLLLPFLVILLLYSSTNLAVSISHAAKKGWTLIFSLPIVFAAIHFSYGFGYLIGLVDFIILRKHQKKRLRNIPLTR